MKKKWALPLWICAAALSCGGLILHCAALQTPQVVAYIANAPLERGEYELVENQYRSGVISYFQENYGAEYGADFWEKTYGGECPEEVLHQRALAQCAYNKVVQIQAKERGLIEDISYAALLEEMEAENHRRSADIAGGKVVYGVAEYRSETYYAYVNSNLLLALERAMGKEELAVTEEELRTWYEHNAEEFRRPADLLLECIPLSDAVGAGGSEALITISEETRREYAKYDEELYQTAMNLAEGQLSPPIQAREGLVRLRCVKRTPGALPSFTEVQEEVASRLLDIRFEAYIQSKYEEAEIKWLT